MPAAYRVLFVCMGNICRSPAGEGVLRHLLAGDPLAGRVEIDSAGTIDLHTGHRADPRMRAAAHKRGIDLTGRARQVEGEDFDQFDLILAMDDENLSELQRLQGARETRAELRSFCEMCGAPGIREVPDPYYGGDDGFERVLDLLQDGCANLVTRLREKLAS